MHHEIDTEDILLGNICWHMSWQTFHWHPLQSFRLRFVSIPFEFLTSITWKKHSGETWLVLLNLFQTKVVRIHISQNHRIFLFIAGMCYNYGGSRSYSDSSEPRIISTGQRLRVALGDRITLPCQVSHLGKLSSFHELLDLVMRKVSIKFIEKHFFCE